MAGSYGHVVNPEGKLLIPRELCDMLECSSGDVYQAVEEMYGMVWYLANKYHAAVEEWMHSEWHEEAGFTVAEAVQEARKNYTEGLELSPGTYARNPREED